MLQNNKRMTGAIVQAKMQSSRFPGKVLKPILDKPMIWHILNRVKAVKLLDKIVVVTTDAMEDKPLVNFLLDSGIEVYTGSKNDYVLDYFYVAAKKYGIDVIVRVTADDPFKDPRVITRAITLFKDSDPALDYVANCSYDGSIVPTYPEGLDIEVFSFLCLEKIWKNATKSSEREHVTPYLFSHKDDFRILGFNNDKDLSGMRWTVDYEQDFIFTTEIYKRLYPKKRLFVMEDILEVIQNEPDLQKINQGIARHEGYYKSLAKEKAH